MMLFTIVCHIASNKTKKKTKQVMKEELINSLKKCNDEYDPGLDKKNWETKRVLRAIKVIKRKY